MTTEHLTALDATFLELEELDEGAHMHIGGLMVFEAAGDGVPTIAELRARVTARLDLMPRYRQRLSAPRTGGLSWPRWEEDARFALEDHVRRATIPAPGGEAELLEWYGDFCSHRLDRARPLWELVLVDGLSGGRWALASKTHHCLVDGMGSLETAGLVVDLPEEPEPPAAAHRPGGGGDVLRDWLPVPPEPAKQATEAWTGAARSTLDAARHPRATLKKATAFVDLLVRDELIPAPHGSLNVALGATRTMAVARAPLAEVKAIRHALGGSVNDVVLAACAGGLRRLLIARGDELPTRGLRAMVPVNVRTEEDRAALGNRVASLFVDLPVAEEDPARRLRKVTAHTQRLKHSGQAAGTGAMIGLTQLAPPVLHSALARTLYSSRLFNITITHVRGPDEPLHALGSRLLEVVPLVPLAADHSIGIAIFSYAGTLVLGLVADRSEAPDIDLLADAVEESFAELRVLAEPVTA